MRQAGIIAAGALYSLAHHRARLAEDHANARALAVGLSHLPGLELDPATVQTNIVMARVLTMPAPNVAKKLAEAGLRVLALGPETIRAVTNLMVCSADISHALEIASRVTRAVVRRK